MRINSRTDLGQQLDPNGLISRDIVMKRPIGPPSDSEHRVSKAHPRSENFGTKINKNGSLQHAPRIRSVEHIASTFEVIPKKASQGQNSGMAPKKTKTPKTVVEWPFHRAWCEATAIYREAHNQTNKEIAASLGISLSYLGAIIGRQKIPSMEVIIQAAYVFGVSPAVFTDHAGLLSFIRAGSLDLDRLKSIIASIEYVLSETKKKLNPVQKSILISGIYNEASVSHGPSSLPTIDEIRNLVRWA